MIIPRRAFLRDAKEMRKLSLSRRVDRNSEESSGLIEYSVPSLEEYVRRIKNGCTYVVDNLLSNTIIGFMDSFAGEDLADIFRDNLITNRIICLEKESFVYSNTLVVSRNSETKGVSSMLLERIVKNAKRGYYSLWGAIVHQPKLNV